MPDYFKKMSLQLNILETLTREQIDGENAVTQLFSILCTSKFEVCSYHVSGQVLRLFSLFLNFACACLLLASALIYPGTRAGGTDWCGGSDA